MIRRLTTYIRMDCKKCKNKDAKPTLDIGRGCEFCRCGGEVSASPCSGCFKLHAYDWLEGMPEVFPDDIFEVRFKNTRKSYYRNVNGLPLKRGDIVAVEASPGHDIGIVSLTGDMVARQMKRVGFNPQNGEFKKIYRKAKPYDIEKWQEAIGLEHETMIRSRQIAASLNLNMKIGDVEYQGDKIKAIFYYIADERVDFRELIKVFAEQFRIRVEMKQIGARQEAGRIGGLGSCGRELCCASWISNFVSVTTNSARHQEISLNPQKLAGQCGKLKCCLVYELDTYLDARKDFPRVNQPLQTIEGDYFLVKSDILERTMWFATDPGSQANLVALPVERVREVIRMNQKGNKPERLSDASPVLVDIEPTFANVVGEESLTRFDKQQGRRKNRKKRKAPAGASQSGDTRSGSPKGAREQKPASGKPENRRSDKPAPGQQPARKQRVPADAAGGAPAAREDAPRRNNGRNRRRNPNGGQNRDGQQSGGGKQEKGGAGE